MVTTRLRWAANSACIVWACAQLARRRRTSICAVPDRHADRRPSRSRHHSSSLLIVQQVAVDLVDETTTSELGRVMSITTKQFTTDKHHAASASRQHWCMWIEQQVAPDVQHTKQVAGKLTTSSCSSAAAGEKAARSTCEPTSSHSALRATGRARQPPSRTRAKLISLSIYLSLSASERPSDRNRYSPDIHVVPTTQYNCRPNR